MSTINAGSEKTRRSYGSPASDLARATCSKSAELSTITLIPALASRPAKVVCNKLTCSPENEVRIVTDWPAGGDPGLDSIGAHLGGTKVALGSAGLVSVGVLVARGRPPRG